MATAHNLVPSPPRGPDLIAPVVNHDAGTVTVAFTFTMKPWASTSKCELIGLLGNISRAVEAHLRDRADENPVAGFEYRCFEPDEEIQMGYLSDYSRGFCTGCGEPMVTTSTSPFFAHVCGPDKVLVKTPPSGCDNIDVGDADGNVIRFANLCAVTLPDPEGSS